MNRTDSAQLAHVVQEEMERWDVPGYAFGVVCDGRIEAWGFGVTSTETRQPVTAGTLFQVGSITKVFTATVIMQLVDEGKLDLDAPVASYLPSLRSDDAATQDATTMRHLLTHQAGFGGDSFKDFGLGDDALAEAVTEVPSLRRWTAPGELWAYSNTGFQIAGAVIEHLLGTTYEQAMRDRVLQPLGLEQSFFFAHEAITYPVAVGHTKSPGNAVTVTRPYYLPRATHAAVGIIASVGDLLRFAAFHLSEGIANGERVLSEAALRAMQEPQCEASLSSHWGLGWAIDELGGVRTIGHGGSTNGFQAHLALVPERRLAVASLTNGNRGSAAIRGVEAWAFRHYAGLEWQAPERIMLSAATLARFAGRYAQPNSQITVTVDDDGLLIDVRFRSPISGTEVRTQRRAVPVGAYRVRVTEGEFAGALIDFIPGNDGAIRFIRNNGRLADRLDA